MYCDDETPFPKGPSQPGHVHVDRLRRSHPGRLPHLAHQLVAAHDIALAAHEKDQQVELTLGELDLPVPLPDPSGSEVDDQVLPTERLRLRPDHAGAAHGSEP